MKMEGEAGRRAKYARMTGDPVAGLVCRMAGPTIVSMMVAALYNMTDTFFVGRLGTSATGAVGIAFPLMAVIQAVGFFFGQGSGNYISRKLGERDSGEAARMAATGFFSAFGAGLLCAAVGLLFLSGLSLRLGATPTMLPHTGAYLRWILAGAPLMMSSLVLNNQLRLQGNAWYGMVGIVSGAVVNMGLDPLFIFVFGLGVGGAALATLLSQLTGFVLLLAGCAREGAIPIRWSLFSPSRALYAEIFRGGLPSLCRQGLASVAAAALNIAMARYGDAAVAAISIVNRVMMFAGSALIGFGHGFQPVCGFNYGAGRYDRVLAAFRFCVRVSTAALLLLALAGYAFAPEVVGFFRAGDAEVIGMGGLALRLQCAVFPLLSWLILCNMMTQNIGDYGKASVLSAARQGLFFLPLVLILPRAAGLAGILLCQPLADVCGFLLAIPLGVSVLRRLRRGAAASPAPISPLKNGLGLEAGLEES